MKSSTLYYVSFLELKQFTVNIFALCNGYLRLTINYATTVFRSNMIS